MEYRREIDGLRALAVLPVILYHAGFVAFSGGYVGVDIFFVISGYLITTIILTEKEKSTFSLVRFYERRARRILPALFFVMLCSMPFAFLWLTPDHLKVFSESLVAVACFSSNILFLLLDGYFSPSAELIPLLHTWSLAVEEQYYLVFPLFLMLLWQLRKRWIFTALFVIAVTSLWLSLWGADNQPAAAFYLLPTRSWELAIGALIAFYFIYKKNQEDLVFSNKISSEIFGLIGLALIVYSIFVFNKTTPFPSYYALVPTIGTGLVIIFATHRTLTGRLLGTRFLVFVGLISYSAYLWHQPIFSFARHRSLEELSVSSMIFLACLSIVLGYFSWRYVEIPFRNKDTFDRKYILCGAIIGSIVFILTGLTGYYSKGFMMRQMYTSFLPSDYLSKTLGPIPNRGIDGGPCVSEQAMMCQFYETSSDVNYLLVGDSHSADYSSAFAAYVRSADANGWQMSVGGCGLMQLGDGKKNENCNMAIDLLETDVAKKNYDKLYFIVNFTGHTRNLPNNDRLIAIDSMTKLIASLGENTKEIIIFTPRHYLDKNVPIKYATLDAIEEVHVKNNNKENEIAWEQAFHRLRLLKNVTIFEQRDELISAGCKRIECFDGHDHDKYALYRDSNHLTAYGAELMWEKYRTQFE